MKTLWIVLGILAGLGLLCCGGVFLFGRNVFKSVVETNEQADRYAKDVFERSVGQWNSNVLIAEGTSDFLTDMPEPVLKQRFEALKAKFGKLTQVEPFTASSTSARNDNGRTTVTVVTSSSAKFEKGTANAQLTVVKLDDKWKVRKFSLD